MATNMNDVLRAAAGRNVTEQVTEEPKPVAKSNAGNGTGNVYGLPKQINMNDAIRNAWRAKR